MIGVILLIVQSIFWIKALKEIELSIAHPISSIVIVLNLIWANIIFKEEITHLNIVGVFFIIIGVTILHLKQTVVLK